HDEGVSIVKVMVWDGCPKFFVSISSNPYTTILDESGEGVIEGSKHGTVSDPDVIISQNVHNEFSILIVYQLDDDIAVEQWDYDHSTNVLSLNLPASVAPDPYIIANGASQPNIDGNNKNEIAITYRKL